MKRRLTSLDPGYRHGFLSVFPQGIDSVFTLFEAANNVEAVLLHKVTPKGKYLIVDDASRFPSAGILKISPAQGTTRPEVLFYNRKIGNQFHLLQRGYGSFHANTWDAGAIVSAPVMAEHHNALKDAIMKIEMRIGLADSTDTATITGMVKALEHRWLMPKAAFKAYPTLGPAPLKVRFQNFSTGYGLHYLWEFGDGDTSSEKHPEHVYVSEGKYPVKLSLVSSLNSQAFTEKPNYITVSSDTRHAMFYGVPYTGLSVTTAAAQEATEPTSFTLIDQTDGQIVERHWFFGDGTDELVASANIHTVRHCYHTPGSYTPSLLVKYADDAVTRTNILQDIMVY